MAFINKQAKKTDEQLPEDDFMMLYHSPKLEEFRNRIAAGGEFTEAELMAIG